MSTAIQRRGRPGLATLIEKFPLILFLALLVWLSVQSPYPSGRRACAKRIAKRENDGNL